MKTINIRFYGELNDFLPPDWHLQLATIKFPPDHTVQDIISFAGIPLSAVDLILVNGKPAGFARELQPHDRISIYPEFRSIDISPLNLINRHSLH